MAHRKVVLCLLGAALATSMISGCSGKKSDPVTVTVWTYYNGDQLDAFNDLTEKFNDTVGKKDGITVETKSLGTAEDLEQNVLAAVNGEVGASEVPNIFFCIFRYGLYHGPEGYAGRPFRLSYR